METPTFVQKLAAIEKLHKDTVTLFQALGEHLHLTPDELNQLTFTPIQRRLSEELIALRRNMAMPPFDPKDYVELHSTPGIAMY